MVSTLQCVPVSYSVLKTQTSETHPRVCNSREYGNECVCAFLINWWGCWSSGDFEWHWSRFWDTFPSLVREVASWAVPMWPVSQEREGMGLMSHWTPQMALQFGVGMPGILQSPLPLKKSLTGHQQALWHQAGHFPRFSPVLLLKKLES